MTTDTIRPAKYAMTFMVYDAYCETCHADTPQSFALQSNTKTMARAQRVKCCAVCNALSLAPAHDPEAGPYDCHCERCQKQERMEHLLEARADRAASEATQGFYWGGGENEDPAYHFV